MKPRSPLDSSRDSYSNDSYRLPSNWRFPCLLREVREKRGFTVDQAVQTLPAVSKKRFAQWEDGWSLPCHFVQTLVIWRLNTAPKPDTALPAKQKRFSWRTALLPCFPVAILVLAVAGPLNNPLNGTKNDLTLEALILHPASEAEKSEADSPGSSQDETARLDSTLARLHMEDQRRDLGDLGDGAKPLIH